MGGALVATAGWSTWESLRRHQGISETRARNILARMLAALLMSAERASRKFSRRGGSRASTARASQKT